MEDESFYIHLYSDLKKDNPALYQNTIGNFITPLNKRLILNGDWECALSRFHYSKSWFNIEEDQLLKLVENGGSQYTLHEKFPCGNYIAVEEVVEVLNELYSDFVKNVQYETFLHPPMFEYNASSNIIRIRLGVKKGPQEGPYRLLYPVLDDYLAEFLGLTDLANRQFPYSNVNEIKFKTKKLVETPIVKRKNELENFPETVKKVLDEYFVDRQSKEPRILSKLPEIDISLPTQSIARNKTFDITKKITDKKKDADNKQKSRSINKEANDNTSTVVVDNTPTKIIPGIQSDSPDPQKFSEFAYVYGFKQVSLFGFTTDLNIYVDILKPVILGNIEAPLLRAVAVNSHSKFGEYVNYEPNTREYVPVLQTEISQIEVDVKNNFNITVPFRFGKIYLSLHFRKVKY